MQKELLTEKIKQTVEILNEKNIDMWLIFVKESSTIHDPSLDIVVGTNVTWHSAFMIMKDGSTHAFVGSLDVSNTKDCTAFENVYGYLKSLKEPFVEFLYKYDPANIAVNYSKNTNLADGLTHGMYLTLVDYLRDTKYLNRLISSEEIVSSLRGRKSAREIDLMRTSVKETERIFDEVTGFIKPGRTEKEIAQFILGKVSERGYETAWDVEHCPAVFTGPDTAGAHAGPTDRKVEKGHLLNIDFGVKINGYCSDMQRTWYILRDGETDAPENVKKGFYVLRDSIRLAGEKLKPGVTGCEIDDVARGHITSNGYDEYPHGLGHQLGRSAHDAGPGLFPRWEKYGTLPYIPLEKSQVFTIEPRLNVEGHGIVTMEEEVVLTESGCEYLSVPQTELILIKG
ncbi:MAG: Xaa-Pro peptidase family protein [Ignavibacteriaceae bacterium]|nr:Xaa-Pro peptidase family protein [Ignavibacteriaceae bacterium]